VIIWDDLHSSRVVETVDQAKMEEMCNAGILRTVQFDVSSTCQSATSRAEDVTSHLDNQEEEIAGIYNMLSFHKVQENLINDYIR
jgi:hypothetical protein